MKNSHIDLTPSPRPAIREKILKTATPLFEAVKRAPVALRTNFPEALRSNNFGLLAHVTRQYAFLEVTTKFRAQPNKWQERLHAYKQIFTSSSSGEQAVFNVNQSRFIQIAKLTAEAHHAFSLGSNFSMCAWEVRSVSEEDGKKTTYDIDAIYVVGFGSEILEVDSWQEFDSLIRLTISDWSGLK